MTEQQRTMAVVNWVRTKKTDHMGHLRLTVHTGARAGWKFRIETVPGQHPRLVANHDDGRHFASGPHATLNLAKAAALDLLHPAEALAWVRGDGSNQVLHTARWDHLRFAVFHQGDPERLFFQWVDTTTNTVSDKYGVNGLGEARQMARGVLWDLFPAEDAAMIPAQRSEVAEGPLPDVVAVECALLAAGVAYTPDQLLKVAEHLAGWAVPSE